MRLEPTQFYRLTPREFQILLSAQRDRMHDDFERAARIALMHEQAARAKKPKLSDLYQRPTATHNDEMLAEKAKEAEHAQEWLDQYVFEARE